jgi:hypothetical protein
MVLALGEIEKYLDKLSKDNPSMAELYSLGNSSGGKDIKAVYITDKDVPLDVKEIAVIMGLRHGDELGVVPAVTSLLDWLVSEEGAETRHRQMVIVIPVVNPDGFVKQEFGVPRDRISDDESKIILPLILKHRADLLLDIHSLERGDLEAVITGHTLHLGEDDLIHGMAAYRMMAGAGMAGYPYALHMLGIQSLAPWLSTPRPSQYKSSAYNNWVCAPAYEKLHSIVIGMEVNDFSLSEDECGKSGLAAIIPLLEMGNTRSLWEYASGYPNRIIRGNMLVSLRAAGQSAEELRKSRVEIWQKRDYFTNPVRMLPSKNRIRAKVEYAGEPLTTPFSICCRIRGNPVIKAVQLNESKTDYYVATDNCSSFVYIDVPAASAGTYEVSIDF